MRYIKILPALALIAGCAGVTPSPEDIARSGDGQLCASYDRMRGNPQGASMVRAEIERRGLIKDPDYWDAISRKGVRVGMPVCVLYAAWGSPDTENRTTTAGGVSIQHVYRGGAYSSKASYAYTRNGIVTSIQN